jgi:hypothetical protein
MPGAVSGAISITTSGGSVTSTSNFTVTATSYPSAQQNSKLVGTGGVTGPQGQGYSVAISADGNTAIVGGAFDNGWIGAAWIYTRSGTTWSQQGSKLVGSGGSGTEQLQGYSVSLSADGNTAIVGGYYDNNKTGAAWIFTRSGTIWTQQGSKLVGTSGIGASHQGYSVSLSTDGNTAIVGGQADNSNIGAAWVFTRSGVSWTQQGKLIGTGGIGTPQLQGSSVSLSADGYTAIVGGYEDNSGVGAAWVFTLSGTTWTQQEKLVGTGGVGTQDQGWSVALSADGNTAIVGGTNDNTNVGAAWVFTRSGTSWTQQVKLVGTGGVVAQQGHSVSLSADGNTAIVGGWDDNSQVGATWVFTRSGTSWTQKGNKLIGTGAVGDAEQGFSVALSADGNTMMVGGQNDNSNIGAVWVFQMVNPVPVTLVSFYGYLENSGVLLNWETVNEINIKNYEIEYSTDGNNFNTIYTTMPKGGSSNYYAATLVPEWPSDNIIYFRLKIINLDGTFTYSYIIKVSNNGQSASVSSLYPNPAANSVIIAIGNNNLLNTKVVLTDMNGEILKSFIIQSPEFSLDISSYSSGMYFIKLSDGELLKLIKQ